MRITPLLPRAVTNMAVNNASGKKLIKGRELISVVPAGGRAFGDKLLDVLITTSLTARLRIEALTMQQVKWKRCVLDIVPLNGSTLNSGYMATYIPDPVAPIPDGGSILPPVLAAFKDTVTTMMWTPSKVSSRNLPHNMFYVVQDGEVRLYSPGRFVVCSMGTITEEEPAQLSFFLDYEVEMTGERTVYAAPEELDVDFVTQSFILLNTAGQLVVSAGDLINLFPNTNYYAPLTGFNRVVTGVSTPAWCAGFTTGNPATGLPARLILRGTGDLTDVLYNLPATVPTDTTQWFWPAGTGFSRVRPTYQWPPAPPDHALLGKVNLFSDVARARELRDSNALNRITEKLDENRFRKSLLDREELMIARLEALQISVDKA